MELAEATGVLARAPGVLTALLADLPEPWLHRTRAYLPALDRVADAE